MNESLQRWRDEFARDPGPAFDRLARGMVPLGAAGQLSLGEILDQLFEPGDEALDQAVAGWLTKYCQRAIPEGTSLGHWGFIIQELFRGLATMELKTTGELLRNRHQGMRQWLHDYYDGPSRDPEGAYLYALARAQNDQLFAPLWRRLILGEELSERTYLGIGILGFRKMPGLDGGNAADVPKGLLLALMTLADKPITDQAKWEQTMRSLFATYRRSKGYWIEQLAPLLPKEPKQSKMRECLTKIFPEIRDYQMQDKHQIQQLLAPSQDETKKWLTQISKNWRNNTKFDHKNFSNFLEQHRIYAKTTGNSEFINKTFNNFSNSLIKANRNNVDLPIKLIEEALKWAPENDRNWTTYAKVLRISKQMDKAIKVLWEARHRFAWNPVIRNDLGHTLSINGYLKEAEDVYREAMGHFPCDVVCRTGLAQTLRARKQFNEARKIFKEAYTDFPEDVICKNGLADLLIDMNQIDEANRLFHEALKISPSHKHSRSGLARTLSIISARNGDITARDEAKSILQKLANEGDHEGINSLKNFDDQWERATHDPNFKFRGEGDIRAPQIEPRQRERSLAEMSIAERIGRAMIVLSQAEDYNNMDLRASYCTTANEFLNIPEEQVSDDLLATWIETRGIALFTSGRTRDALEYFEQQVNKYGRGRWNCIRIGMYWARILLGMPCPDDIFHDTEQPSTHSTRFPYLIELIIKILSAAATSQELEVRELLISLLKERNFSLLLQVDRKTKAPEDGADMLRLFLHKRWLQPIDIKSPEDLNLPEVFPKILKQITNTMPNTLSVITNAVH